MKLRYFTSTMLLCGLIFVTLIFGSGYFGLDAALALKPAGPIKPTVPVPLHPGNAVQPSDAIQINAACDAAAANSRPVIQEGQSAYLLWGWTAYTKEQIQNFLDAAHVEIQLDGAPVRADWPDFASPIRRTGQSPYAYGIYWYIPIGSLKAGQHKTTYRTTFDVKVFDGYDFYGPTTDQEEDTGSCTFTVNAAAASNQSDAAATDAVGKKIFGPLGLPLDHKGGGNEISSIDIPLSVADFVLEVTFFNPYDASTADWSYGIFFRSQGGDQQYRLVIRSRSDWILGYGASDDWIIAQGRLSNLNTAAGGSNKLRLVVTGPRGRFYVNGTFIDLLNVSKFTNEGIISVVTGALGVDQVAGKSTRFDNLTIWEPAQATAAPAQTATEIPSATPTAVPTQTPAPTETPVPTETPSPTLEPTVVPCNIAAPELPGAATTSPATEAADTPGMTLTIGCAQFRITSMQKREAFGGFSPRDPTKDVLLVITGKFTSPMAVSAFEKIEQTLNDQIKLVDDKGRESQPGTLQWKSDAKEQVTEITWAFIVTRSADTFTLHFTEGQTIPLKFVAPTITPTFSGTVVPKNGFWQGQDGSGTIDVTVKGSQIVQVTYRETEAQGTISCTFGIGTPIEPNGAFSSKGQGYTLSGSFSSPDKGSISFVVQGYLCSAMSISGQPGRVNGTIGVDGAEITHYQ